MGKIKHRKFFIKEAGDISVVGKKYFDCLKRADALGIGVQIYLELQQQLKHNRPSYIGTIKLIDGMTRSLEELEARFPFILHEINSVDRKTTEGLRVARA